MDTKASGFRPRHSRVGLTFRRLGRSDQSADQSLAATPSFGFHASRRQFFQTAALVPFARFGGRPWSVRRIEDGVELVAGESTWRIAESAFAGRPRLQFSDR